MEQEPHPSQHPVHEPLIDRDLVPLNALSPQDHQRIVNDLVTLVGAVLGCLQHSPSLAKALAAEVSAGLVGEMRRMGRSECDQLPCLGRCQPIHDVYQVSAVDVRRGASIGGHWRPVDDCCCSPNTL